MKKIAIVGSTGSIGKASIKVIQHLKSKFSIYALAAKENYLLLAEQILAFKPRIIVVGDSQIREKLYKLISRHTTNIQILTGEDGLNTIATDHNIDTIIFAMTGTSGIIPLINAIKHRKQIALATKELLVSFGKIIMHYAERYNNRIMPIDSELVGLHQCFSGHSIDQIKRIIITASGGPFYQRTNLKNISINEALKHPIWQMGKKNTIDSATLANKGLEIIEASNLFSIPSEKIQVVIHPQSIIHALIELNDNSVIAQLSIPDMKICIQYALTYPDRSPSIIKPIDFSNLKLTFSKPNLKKFPALQLAYQALRINGIAPCVYNSANEVAVNYFLEGKIDFMTIPKIIKKTLQNMPIIKNPSLTQLLKYQLISKNYAQGLI